MNITPADIAKGLRFAASLLGTAEPAVAAEGQVWVGVAEAAKAALLFAAWIAEQGKHVPTEIARIKDAEADFAAATAAGEKYARSGE